VRPLIPNPDPTRATLRWLDAVITLPLQNDPNQREILMGHYMVISNLTDWETNSKRGLVIWNDTSQQFDIVSVFPPNSCVAPKGDVGTFSFSFSLSLSLLS
jgi:hypothetical protein